MMFPIQLPPPALPQDLEARDTVHITWTVTFKVCSAGHLHSMFATAKGVDVVRYEVGQELQEWEHELTNPNEGGADGSEEDGTGGH